MILADPTKVKMKTSTFVACITILQILFSASCEATSPACSSAPTNPSPETAAPYTEPPKMAAYPDPPETAPHIAPPAMAPNIGIAPLPNPPAAGLRRDGIFDVTEHGAVADGATESGLAFLGAWEAACNHAGNSTFYVPEGTFLVGPIIFSGPCYNNESPNVRIVGALVAPPSLKSFPSSDWIVFRNVNGVIITGGDDLAKIDAQGEAEAWKQVSCEKSSKCKHLVTSLRFSNVSSAIIRHITLSNSKGFHVGFYGSRNISVYNVNITAPWDSPNTDGIHISHSSNINITDSRIGVGDDCVSIGPGSLNVSVSNIHCGPGHGISIGSLGKYKNEEDVKGISVWNSTISGTQNGVRVKTWPKSPTGYAYDMTFQNIIMINVSNPIIIDQVYCPSHSCNPKFPSLVKLNNITFKNISGTYNTDFAVTLHCSTEVACENIRLLDINLNDTTAESPREGRFSVKGVLHGLEVLSSSF